MFALGDRVKIKPLQGPVGLIGKVGTIVEINTAHANPYCVQFGIIDMARHHPEYSASILNVAWMQKKEMEFVFCIGGTAYAPYRDPYRDHRRVGWIVAIEKEFALVEFLADPEQYRIKLSDLEPNPYRKELNYGFPASV